MAFASSTRPARPTYGDGALGYSDEDAVTEKLIPLNMYGYSKHMFDLWALRRRHFDKIVGLKYFNVYGPYEDHKGDMRSLVHKAYHQIKKDGYIELFKSDRPDFKDGEQKRDFVYVRDAAKVTVHFALNSTVGGLFNCGASQARTWIDLATALFAAMDRKPDIRFIELPEILRGKYQYFTQADSAKLRKARLHAAVLSPSKTACGITLKAISKSRREAGSPAGLELKTQSHNLEWPASWSVSQAAFERDRLESLFKQIGAGCLFQRQSGGQLAGPAGAFGFIQPHDDGLSIL